MPFQTDFSGIIEVAPAQGEGMELLSKTEGASMTPALDGIKVVDISQVAAVPMTARLMADYGAEVVHVEHPGRGDLLRESLPLLTALESDFHYVWENYNHNKKSIAIDISKPEGQAIAHKMIAGADVFLSNLRPYQLTAFDLEYDRLSELNPGLIFGNVSGTINKERLCVDGKGPLAFNPLS